MNYKDGYSDAIDYALDLVEPLYFDLQEIVDMDTNDIVMQLKELINDLRLAKNNADK